jgi:hypothetical protein
MVEYLLIIKKKKYLYIFYLIGVFINYFNLILYLNKFKHELISIIRAIEFVIFFYSNINNLDLNLVTSIYILNGLCFLYTL